MSARGKYSNKVMTTTTAAPPAGATCAGCQFYRAEDEPFVDPENGDECGRCTRFPPSIVTGVGPLVRYGFVRQTLPACGEYLTKTQ